MNYGRIRRGPMAADAFTQIRNALFRDNRLSFRDKGIFGLISTHRDGFGVSAESIAACSPTDGITAVKASLRSLETYGYLQRTRQRNKNGTLGSAVYFITDMPERLEADPELENRRSEPAVAQPPVAEPTLVQPTVAEPAVAQPTVAELPHKNTNSKKTSSKNTTSSRVPKPRPAAPPVKAEEEGSTATTPEHQRARLFLMRLPAPWTLGPADAAKVAPVLAAAVSRLGLDYDDRLTAQIACNDFGVQNHAAVIETKRIPNLRPRPAAPTTLPPACPACLEVNPAAASNKKFRTHNGLAAGRRCATCHPDAAPAAA